jgi:tetratricopeptide (TPR) repeat protein
MLGKTEEAAVVIKNALPLGNVFQLQQLGRQLLAAKNPKAALEVFEFNFNKNPGQFTTLVGMARGLSANGEYAKALEFANKSIPLAPNDANKQAILEMVQKLKSGKDIN